MIPCDLIEEPHFSKALAAMEFVPVRVELLYHSDAFEYIGMSAEFEEWAHKTVIPEYMLRIDLDLEGFFEGIEVEKIGGSN